jgi:ADP-ribose pyrophosphatase YjhB (NUDIX family)
MESRTIVCVGAVVKRGETLLAVRQAEGHSLAGQWTIPWGILEQGESPAAAAIREVAEEAAIVASVDGLLGVQELPDPQRGWFALLYMCRHVSGTPQPDNRETDAAGYFSLREIDELSDPIEPWSEWVIRKALRGDLTMTPANPENPFYPEVGFI